LKSGATLAWWHPGISCNCPGPEPERRRCFGHCGLTQKNAQPAGCAQDCLDRPAEIRR
jgi:hypothetical protein